MSANAANALKPPTRTSRTFVRYLRGFALVGFLVVPIAGAQHAPGIRIFAEFVPRQLDPNILLFAAVLMSSVCLLLEFWAGERITRARLRRLSKRLAWTLAIAFVLFLVFDQFVVERWRTQDGRLSIIRGLGERTDECRCPDWVVDEGARRGVGPRECISLLHFDEGDVANCWGSGRTGLIILSMQFLYLLIAFAFSALVGVLIVREKVKQKERGQGKKQSKPRGLSSPEELPEKAPSP